MPGSVQNAVTATVMPWNLARQFTRTREFPLAMNVYPDASSQRRLTADTPRAGWRIVHRLTAAAAAELQTFFLDHVGQAFLFYDVHETDPAFNYDETGVAETGRYAVRFEGAWDQTVEGALTECPIELVEVG